MTSGQTHATSAQGEFWTPPLALVTGTLDPVWKPLELGDEMYPVFRWAFMWQEQWFPGEHLTYWQTHLRLWPRKSRAGSGLVAAHAAQWMRAGYSQTQIARALGYKPGDAPKSLWRTAKDYADWLATFPYGLRPNGLGAVQLLEDMYGDGAEIAAGRLSPQDASVGAYALTDDPEIADHLEDADVAERARRWVRRRYRTPRVVTLEEWETPAGRFGWPESISTRLVYGDTENIRLEGVDAQLREEEPFHAAQESVSAQRRAA